MKPIVIHRKARIELDQAIGYYERQKRGLGLDLESEVEKTVATIQANPALGSPYKASEFRFFLVRRFPYVIYYIDVSESIWIVAIAHGSKRPDYWRKRKVKWRPVRAGPPNSRPFARCSNAFPSIRSRRWRWGRRRN